MDDALEAIRTFESNIADGNYIPTVIGYDIQPSKFTKVETLKNNVFQIQQ